MSPRPHRNAHTVVKKGPEQILADGAVLPAWLSFDAASRTFSGTPPEAGSSSVRMGATDTGGLSATDLFELRVDPHSVISGTAGNDTLVGGTGSETLQGGTGDDVFLFNLGDGQDVICPDDADGTDTLSFGAGITVAGLRLEKSGSYDLVIRVGSDGDQVRLANWYHPSLVSQRMDQISFADGTSMAVTELTA